MKDGDVSYIDFSPFLPNIVTCFREIFSVLRDNTPQRLIPTYKETKDWLSEAWELQYTSFYLDMEEIFAMMIIAFGLILLRTVLGKIIFQHWLHVTEQESKRFMESCWKISFTSCTTAFTLCMCFISERKIFFYPGYLYGKANWVPGQRLSSLCYGFLIAYGGYYIQCMYAQFFLDEKKKDFFVTLLHHCITLTLIIWNLGLRYAELGILTIMIHDASDPLLETTRLFSHLSAHKKSGHLFKTISSVTLVIFLFEWILFRLYWYPTKVMHTIICVFNVLFSGKYAFSFAINVIIIVLYFFHLYWTVIIFKAVVRAIRGKGLKDSRNIDSND